MDRTTAVETWREVCGSDTVMAMMPLTGRMLEDFARRIEAVEREACAKVCDDRAVGWDNARPARDDSYAMCQAGAKNEARALAAAIRARSNAG